MAKYLLTGVTSLIGMPLRHALQSNGDTTVAVSRQATWPVATQVSTKTPTQTAVKKAEILQWDMQGDDSTWQAGVPDVDALLHCAPIWLLPKHISALASVGVRRIIAFSSTSVEGKQYSNSPQEQQIVRQLAQAEQQCRDLCQQHDIALTLFRPTMIYGYGHGQNLAFISRIIQRMHCFVLAGAAKGLRQPVHVDDLVQAVLAAVHTENSYGKTYNLAGREVITYRQMVQRLFEALGQTPRTVSLPTPLYRQGLALLRFLASAFGRQLPVDPAMADRMQQDLQFDYNAATIDFGYSPGPFLPNGAADIVTSEPSPETIS